MKTEIFYGGFGTGKTAEMLKRIRETAMRGEQCLLFVPEQFSFDTERTVYFEVGARYCRYVKVTGFSKLSREILRQYNKANPCADEAVKLITMWKTAENAKEDFLSFGKEKNSSGFCRLMLKTVAAFRNAGISPEDYRKILEEETSLDEELADKAGDFLRIYTDYDREIKENLKLDDKLDDVSRAAALAEEHEYFKGLHLFFDNYDSFSAVQQKLLRAALPCCDSSLFCFSCDRAESKKREFLCVCKTLRELSAIIPDIVCTEFKNEYRTKGRDSNSVKIFRAKTPYDEADLAAAEIHRMVRDEGLRYRDILVLTADREYESILSRRFADGEIPVFCDFPRPMTDKPVVDFVLQILRALEFDPEELLRLAESGFKRIFDEGKQRLLFASEVYRLRAASDSYGLSAEDFTVSWEGDPRRELSDSEKLRAGIVQPLLTLKTELSEAEDGAAFSEIFMRYLIDSEQIGSTFIAASKAGDGGETDYIKVDETVAEEYSRIWEALCEAFTSMAYCLEGVKISSDKYLSLLEEILSVINLANPPQVLDSVTVGDIERTRKAEPKAVIIVGASEGKIPVKNNLQSVFTHLEREHLNNAGLPLYDSELNRWSKEYYFALRAMSLYGKRLVITFPNQDVTGKEAQKAEMLKERFGEVGAADSASLPPEYFLNTISDVRALSARAYKRDVGLYSELLPLLEDPGFGIGLSEAARLIAGDRGAKLTPETAKKIFAGSDYSPTKLESAFKCPFMYFCKYGLGLRERDDKDQASPSAIGSAVHNIMRIALKAAGDVRERTETELEEIAEKSVLEAAEQAIEENPAFPERTRSIYSSLSGRIAMLLKQTKLDSEAGGFVPKLFEKEVGYSISDGEINARIKGVADRIDMMESENVRLIRIFDYKTGSGGKQFTKSGIESGADLQMLLYLFAECENEKDSRPAAVGYFEARGQGLIRTDSTSPLSQKEINKNWFSRHKISGAVFDGSEAAAAADGYESAVKEKTGSSRSKFSENMILSEKKFTQLREHIDKDIILPKIKELLEGNIDALPLESADGELPCGFCELQCICGNKGKRSRAAGDGREMDEFAGKELL